jgi:hypothetical protein
MSSAGDPQRFWDSDARNRSRGSRDELAPVHRWL